jgi:hypothetical protein
MSSRVEKDAPPEAESEHGANGPKMEPLSFRRLRDILAMQFDDADFVLRNGYLTKGEACAICGAGSIGKSRLVSQLIRDMLTGRRFLDRWVTSGKKLNVLVLQSENSNRRMKSELFAQTSMLTEEQKDHIHDHCVFHTLENSDDSFLTLESAENQLRIENAISEYKPDLIIWDVLRDFAVDDPNSDKFMQQTLSLIGRLTRKRNPACIPLILHHGRTGKAGAASATGFDRGSFGRNSKVLFSWVRAQINVAAYNKNDSDTLIVASGKCNNAEEFKPFAIRLDTSTMSYGPDESITDEDIEAWHEEMTGDGASSKRKKPKTKADLLKLVPELKDIPKNVLMGLAAENGISEKKFPLLYSQLIDDNKIYEHRVKRAGKPDQKRVSRYEHPF